MKLSKLPIGTEFTTFVFSALLQKKTERPDSDVDFLVDLDKGRSLLDIGGMAIDLQQLLGRKVDIVTEKGLHWYIKETILNEAKPL